MSLLKLLHNEKVVRLLEKLDVSLKDAIEPNGDLSFVVPSVVMMLELILKQHNVSDIADVILKKREKELISEDIHQLKMKISELNYKIDMANVDITEIDAFTKGSYESKTNAEKHIIDTISKELIENKKLNYGNI
jgi:hypothetical protein